MSEGGDNKTHFGYREVAASEKQALVGRVFTSVADRYDLMNDLMSLGIHRLWKRHFVSTLCLRRGQRVLDLAGGTGDIAALMVPRVGRDGRVILGDINVSMLRRGRDRLIDIGRSNSLSCAQLNAEELPFPSGTFDVVTIAFGLRNVTDQSAALAEMYRVLKPGGRAGILEFSAVPPMLRPLYDWYSFTVLPRLGKWVADDAESYRYLAESIRRHPPQEALRDSMLKAGFDMAEYRNLSAGLVAVHTGYRT